jgi:hypothetical protein
VQVLDLAKVRKLVLDVVLRRLLVYSSDEHDPPFDGWARAV